MPEKMTKREKYLERAREADQKAVETKDYAAGEIWKRVAASYRKLAERADEGH